MQAFQPQPLDFDALVEMENASPIRHEYIGGRLYAMAGGTVKHADVIVNVTIAVGGRLRGKPCRGSSSDQRVRTSQTATNWYYPDFLIKCPPPRFHPRDKTALLNPHAIFEVLSPETEKFDRTTKFDEYTQIEELSDYVLVSTEIARVEHFRRLGNGAWELRSYTRLDEELRLDNFGISVPLGEIYEDVEVAEQLILPQFDPDSLS
ncbi:Endonuclease, Uma2 family (restriction endonuclease fold) [Abditibacterium utsteinense]|uniref:Endonuclease, Uma2 family (Restriction endonuclease fold) n=1 Tax=Abditibacterium utsteinense TaxID=1960156 RepID=A0A2S8SQP1_9BACT|nr:Uma2 family endonuclease [Abditibacterium utsteinense]PQV63113.1 Endonuclease, Uma2 family (restriction endonuclease fold) [Abditibacterium utsteinense]